MLFTEFSALHNPGVNCGTLKARNVIKLNLPVYDSMN
jgi:hypothetical protein